MRTQDLKIAYIGTSESYFTRTFLPALQKINYSKLIFICVRQNEFRVVPEKAGLLLKCMITLKQIKSIIQEKSSLIYWSVYCKQYLIQYEIVADVNSDNTKDFLEECDFVLAAGIRAKFDRKLLEAPKNGVINFHYSLLPKYRGTNPVFWQKVQNDWSFGYTFHLMDESIDHGNIVVQNQIHIKSGESVSQICDSLTDHAADYLRQLVFSLFNARPQTENELSIFTNKEYIDYIRITTKENGSIWHQKCLSTNLFILNEKWLVHLENAKSAISEKELLLNGLMTKDGFHFKFKKINYLPPVFYYFALRNHFE